MIIPTETHYFHGKKVVDERFKKATDEELFCRKLIDFWYTGKTRINDLGLNKEEILLHADHLNLWSPIDLYLLHLTIYRKQRNKEILGEKTPLHILHIDEILETFPNTKIISLFRDPRAAANSEIKAYFGSPSVIVTTDRWKRYVEVHFEMLDKLSADQYMMLQYKDLISSPEERLREISTFLELDYQPAMMEYYKREEKGFAQGESEWKKETLKPLQEGKNKEWRHSLTDWQVALVEKYAGEYLSRMGYKPAAKKLSFVKKVFYTIIDGGRSYWSTFTNSRDEGYNKTINIKF
jgi:hypothetical protein